jgi:hypothetical protein
LLSIRPRRHTDHAARIRDVRCLPGALQIEPHESTNTGESPNGKRIRRTIDDLIAKLQRHLAALDGGGDCTSDTERASWYSSRTETQRTITGLMNPDLEKPLHLLAEAEERRAAVVQKEAEIEQELAVVPVSFADSRARDREYDRQQLLHRQLKLLHAGDLLRAPGVTYERTADLDVRIAELQQRIATLRARIDAHVQTAAQLLGETVAS